MFYFLLMGHVSVKEMLLETLSPGEEHLQVQATQRPRQTQPGARHPAVGRALGLARAAGRGQAAQQPES